MQQLFISPQQPGSIPGRKIIILPGLGICMQYDDEILDAIVLSGISLFNNGNTLEKVEEILLTEYGSAENLNIIREYDSDGLQIFAEEDMHEHLWTELLMNTINETLLAVVKVTTEQEACDNVYIAKHHRADVFYLDIL